MTLWSYMYCLVAGKVIPNPLEGYLDLDFLRPNGSAYRSSILVKLIVTEYPHLQPCSKHIFGIGIILKKGKGKEVLFYISNSK